MLKNIAAAVVGTCLVFFSGISLAGFFESDWWNEAIYSVSDPVAVPGGISQSGTAELYFSDVDANLTSQVQGQFQENGFDRLTVTFGKNGETIGFTDLGRDAAEQWAKDNADDLIQIVFGSIGSSLAGQDAAHAEAGTVMSEMILTSSKGSKQKAKGLTISTLKHRGEGALSYTGFDNRKFSGNRYGITLGYRYDISEEMELSFLLPYSNITNDDSTDTNSHVIMPSIGLSYKVINDENAEVKIGANLQATGVYSDSDIGNLGYGRYAGTFFGSYRYFMNDQLTVTGGASYGIGKFYTPSLGDEYEYLENAFDSMGTDSVFGLGFLVEYEVSSQLGLDFYIYGAHNFNSDSNSEDQITFGPQLRYSIYDSFDVNLGYRRSQDFSGDNDFSSDTIMLNAIYDF